MDKKVQEIMAEETKRQRDEELRRTVVLAQKSGRVVLGLCLLMAVAPYIYTRRWGALLVLLGALFTVGMVAPEDWEPGLGFGALVAVVAGVDNYAAIQRARERIVLLQENQDNDSHLLK